jgi:purine-binding chemotaxis protein CheW
MSTALGTVDEAIEEQRDLFLTFHLNGEDYGIAITHIIEIIGIQKITRIPDMPIFIEGIINLRGRVIPVMDVRLRFGMSPKEHDDRTCVIVIQVGDSVTGLIVDRVKEVLEIPAGMIEPAPKTGRDDGYILGIGKVAEEVKILLNVEELVSEETLEESCESVA